MQKLKFYIINKIRVRKIEEQYNQPLSHMWDDIISMRRIAVVIINNLRVK